MEQIFVDSFGDEKNVIEYGGLWKSFDPSMNISYR